LGGCRIRNSSNMSYIEELNSQELQRVTVDLTERDIGARVRRRHGLIAVKRNKNTPSGNGTNTCFGIEAPILSSNDHSSVTALPRGNWVQKEGLEFCAALSSLLIYPDRFLSFRGKEFIQDLIALKN
jgi:hypothetical protein